MFAYAQDIFNFPIILLLDSCIHVHGRKLISDIFFSFQSLEGPQNFRLTGGGVI